ncbi:TPA: hypothetical protein ACKJZ5_002144, partial [Neisseria gonorrhoeae]|uniref:hypothetical protein n=13 Tax=Neisseriaceae TaxID=481 RepID=UPI001C859E7D
IITFIIPIIYKDLAKIFFDFILGISLIHAKIQPNVEKKITANTTLPPLTSNQTDSRFGWKLVYLLFNGECQCSYP